MGAKHSLLEKNRRHADTPMPPPPPVKSHSPRTPVILTPIYRLDFNDKQLSRYYTNPSMATTLAREFRHTHELVKIDRPPILDLTCITYSEAESAVFDGELTSVTTISVVQPVTLDGIFDEFVLFRIHCYRTATAAAVRKRIQEMLLVHVDLQIDAEIGYIKKKKTELDDPEYIDFAIEALGYMLFRRRSVI